MSRRLPHWLRPSSWRLPSGRNAVPLVLSALVFLLDMFTPLGIAHGMVYVLPVLSTLLTRDLRLAMGVTTACLVLVPVGVLVSPHAPEGVPLTYVIFNRLLAMAVIMLVGLLTVRKLHLIIRLQASNRDLLQTSRLLQTATALGKLGGWSADVDSGRVHWSAEVARMHGALPVDAPLLKDGVVRVTPEFEPLLRERVGLCIRHGEPFDVDLQIHATQGEPRWVRLVGEPVFDGDGRVNAIQGALQDIHDRKIDQIELASSMARLKAFAESLPLTVWTANTKGAIRYASPHMCAYTGAQPQELLNQGWLYWVHPQDRARVSREWAHAVETKEPYWSELRMLGADGAYRWHINRAVFLPQEAPTRSLWCGTAVDIQELKQLQTHSKQLADQLGATMESVGDAIYTLDKDWRFVLLNARAEVLLRRDRAALVGRRIWDEFPHLQGSAVEAAYRRCRDEGAEVRFDTLDDASGKHHEIIAYPFDGGLTVCLRDVTDQRQLAEQLRQAQKLEALGQLTGGVAHDFNNLLTVILGNAETLIERREPADAGHAQLAAIVSAAQSGAAMTQRLLAFARKQSLAPRVVQLNQLAERMLPMLKRLLGDHIDVTLNSPVDLWPTLVDPAQLESALLNLAINARDAMPGGGLLTLTMSNVPGTSLGHQGEESACSDSVCLTVRDTGHGIAPEVMDRIFEPFFTTKPKGEGTGLGLPMVYGFVKQTGGHIAIQSHPGLGTEVQIHLPRLLDEGLAPVPPVEPAVLEPLSSACAGERILLVEDDPGVRDYAEEVLQTLGYQVLVASNGPEALAYLRGRDDIDLLFTDMVMPGGLSGAQLAEQARALHPGLPVLFATGFDEGSVARQGLMHAATPVLTKPYRRAALTAKLREALEASDRQAKVPSCEVP